MSQLNKKFTASDLLPGQTYQVIAAFKDYSGTTHHVGESWRFVEKHFLSYEDGLTLIVEKDGQSVWIQLQWRPESQGEIIDHFYNYIQAQD